MHRIIASMQEEQLQTATAETRKLATIMFTDMVGFGRQMDVHKGLGLKLARE